MMHMTLYILSMLKGDVEVRYIQQEDERNRILVACQLCMFNFFKDGTLEQSDSGQSVVSSVIQCQEGLFILKDIKSMHA